MLLDILKDYKIILGSSSPRRQEFLKKMGFTFELRPSSVEEVYPRKLKGSEISDYLACLKANSLKANLKPKEILITSDTVVWHNSKSLAKPVNKAEAFEMLKTLNNDRHTVITSVCLTTTTRQEVDNAITEVTFDKLSESEINYYIETHTPYDKAGAYGIQEWIGLVAIKDIKGSHSSVVGLPTHLVYNMLKEMIAK